MQQLTSLNISERAVNVLDTEPGLKVAIIYGSVVSGNMRPDSDVDLAVLFDSPMGDPVLTLLCDYQYETKGFGGIIKLFNCLGIVSPGREITRK